MNPVSSYKHRKESFLPTPGRRQEFCLGVQKIFRCSLKKVHNLFKVFDNADFISLVNVYSKLMSILLENKRHWIKCVALSVSWPRNAGLLRPRHDVPSVPHLRVQLETSEEMLKKQILYLPTVQRYWCSWNFCRDESSIVSASIKEDVELCLFGKQKNRLCRFNPYIVMNFALKVSRL